MKPIFEPGDFKNLCTCHPLHHGERCLAMVYADTCNAKLASLGIDAETPEKLSELRNTEAILNLSLQNQRDAKNVYQRQVLDLEARIAELEHMVAEAPVVYGVKFCGKWIEFGEASLGDDTHRARLIQIEELPKP